MEAVPLKNIGAQTYGREDQEMIVQWQICEYLRNERRSVDIDEFKKALSPEFWAFERRDKVEDGDHNDTLNWAVEVSQKQDASIVFLPSRKIEVT